MTTTTYLMAFYPGKPEKNIHSVTPYLRGYYIIYLTNFLHLVQCRAEMRMVRWRCNVKVKDRVPSKTLRERLRIDDIILILQQNRLRWYGICCEKKTMTG